MLPSILTPDFGLIFWMLAAFLIVFILLARFGFPVITKMVEDRKSYIDESLQKAREANEKLANIQSEGEKLLKEAREKQAQIIKEAMATRDSIISAAQEKALVEGHKLLEEAHNQIENEKEDALRDIRATVAELSVSVAEKIVRHQLDKTAEQQKYMELLLNEVLPAKK